MMARVRAADTKPEMVLRRGLHRAGFRFKLHARDLPGRPDIVLRKHRSVIFVHGCFWHGHSECGHFRLPKTRTEFWRTKIEANRARDARSTAALVEASWRVLVVWECATRTLPQDQLIEVIAAWLKADETSAELSSAGMSSRAG